MEGVITNVWSRAIDTMASQIDGLAKNSIDRTIGPRNNDPKKIEDLFVRFDTMNLVFSLVDDVRNYISWNGQFENLVLCIGVGIKRDANNDCLTSPDGIFVSTEQTLNKFGGRLQEAIKEKRIRFAMQMIQLVYSLMMGSDVIIDGFPFQQYLGPLSI